MNIRFLLPDLTAMRSVDVDNLERIRCGVVRNNAVKGEVKGLMITMGSQSRKSRTLNDDSWQQRHRRPFCTILAMQRLDYKAGDRQGC